MSVTTFPIYFPVDERPPIDVGGGNNGGSNGNNNDSPPSSIPTKRTKRERREITSNGSARGLAIPAILGKQRIGLQKVYENSFSNSMVLYFVAVHCYGPVKSITPRADDVALTDKATHWQDATGLVKVWNYDGSQTGLDTASGLRSADPKFDEYYPGLAYSIIRLQYDNERLTAVPTFTFDIEGYELVYDPRSGTVGYSENTALFIRELLTNTTWGLRVPSTGIDEASFIAAADDCDATIFPAAPTLVPSVAAGTSGNLSAGAVYRWLYTHVSAEGIESLSSPASGTLTLGSASRVSVTIPASVAGSMVATKRIYRSANGGTYRYVGAVAAAVTAYEDNASDASIANSATPPTSQPRPQRYYSGHTISRTASGSDWLGTLKAHCMGVLTIDNGKYQLRIDKPVPAGYQPKRFSTVAFTDYDGTSRQSNVEPRSVQIARKERAFLFNQITVNFTDVANGFVEGSVTRERPNVTAQTVTPRLATYELSGLPDKNVATRIATQYLNRAWDDLVVTFKASRDAIAVLPWDVIEFTGGGPPGTPALTAQWLRVLSVKTSGEDFLIEAVEYQPTSYNDTINPEDSPIQTDLPDPSAVPPNPTGVNASEDKTIGPNGLPTSKIKVEWVPGETPFYRNTRIVVHDGLQTYTLPEAQVGPVYITQPRKGALHTITLYTVTHRNVLSTGASVTCTPTFTDEVVPDVTNVSIPFDYENQGTVYFTPPAYDYASHFEILDNHGAPATPPVIYSVPASSVQPGVQVKAKLGNYVRGDGYSTPRSFSIIVKTVSVTGEKSGGYPIAWTIDPTGIGTVNVGLDPRDAIIQGDYIWVTNYASNTVQKLDRFTRSILSTHATATKPYGIVFDEPTGFLYLANYGSDSVSRMTTTGTRTDVALGAGTGPLGVASDGAAVWVTCHTSNQLKRISGTAVTHTLAVGTKPCLPYVYNGRVYVANYGSNNVTVYDTTTFGLVATVQVGSGPFGLCEAGGYLWVANYSASTISKINPSTNTVVATITLGAQSGPTDIAYDGDGCIWVSEAVAQQLTKVNIFTHKLDGHIPQPSSPRTVIYDGINLFTPNNTNGTSGTISITATSPAPGGGSSNAFNFVVTGADLSPLPN